MSDAEPDGQSDDAPRAPFPVLPPPPSDPGEYLTSFTADIQNPKINGRDGCLILPLKIPATDKYLAMPLTDIRGRRFRVTVHAPHGRRPLVANGVMAVYGARERRLSRAADRRWQRTRRDQFEGSDGEV